MNNLSEKRHVSVDEEQEGDIGHFPAPEEFDFVIKGEKVIVTQSDYRARFSRFGCRVPIYAPVVARLQYLCVRLEGRFDE